MLALISMLGLWITIGFLVLPAILIFALQLWLCFKIGKFVLKFVPILAAVALCILVALCAGTGFLSFLAGGVVGLVALLFAGAVITASIVGWAVYAIIKVIRG
ncbi:MAG TPA: hypothetical protein IAD01_01290 [Candidatus Faeciplasma gallinarum]|uniref:Uncharacterized protein n=1 Tax=Candidatus Faeciplasma gallinarum TaxID=2840799 RepID=A0A9D1JH92_9FIRM|nr:hypothetical protein [Candidatus Faeciplasma gallinarum]